MIELRWLQQTKAGKTYQDGIAVEVKMGAPELQYRTHIPAVDASGAFCPGEWSKWKDVPTATYALGEKSK